MHRKTELSAITRERPITIRVPARAAYDLDSFQKVVANLAERLGCPNCISGANCWFSLERDFLVNPQSLAIESIAASEMIDG